MKNYYIILNNWEELKNKMEELKNKYRIDDFDIKIYDADKVDIKKITQEINYEKISSEKKLFIIKNIESFSKKECEELYKILENLPSDVIFILYGENIEQPFEIFGTKEKTRTPEEKFFKSIFSLRYKDYRKIYEIIDEYLKVKEKDFQRIISGIEIYLKNLVLKERKLTEETIKKFEYLHKLDFYLKTGMLDVGEELKIHLIYYFFSTFI